jgi:hypothetical protein
MQVGALDRENLIRKALNGSRDPGRAQTIDSMTNRFKVYGPHPEAPGA